MDIWRKADGPIDLPVCRPYRFLLDFSGLIGMARTLYGTRKDGAPVHAFTLGGGTGLSATILDMGGTITAIGVTGRNGKRRNIVLGLKDLAAYEASGWWNCLIGRYANRLKNGVTIEGRHYPLSPDAGGVTLHGGRGASWGTRLWDVIAESETSLHLRLLSPDGDQGFPGAVITEVTYSVTPDSLRLDYAATSNAPTVINLTNHLYFNLAGAGSVLPQELQLNADAMTPTDVQQIPTGQITAVAGTPFDFRAPTIIGMRVNLTDPQMALARGLDHNFVLNKSAPGALDWAVRMRDPDSGLMLEVLTTQPGIQVYSTNNVKPGQFNAEGLEIQKRDGLALETQHFPDSPNRPDFPSTRLMPGAPVRSTTVFRFPA
jgi:aldose 1-epimerase